jgi:hypothetical protein
MVEIIHHKYIHLKEIQAMKDYTTVLGNLLSSFPRSEFEKSVQELKGDHRTRVLSTYDLLKTLIYGQVTQAFSVREIEASLSSNSPLLYHNGMNPVKRSTLCDALKKRDQAIFEKAFYALVDKAKYLSSKAGKRFKSPLTIIDASTIELCLKRFNWAKFRTTKGALKLHLAMDGDGCFPEQVQITTGAVHEVNKFSELADREDRIYVVDRGYIDFKILYDINLNNSIFVTRMKKNCQFELVSIDSFSKKGPIRLDTKVKLSNVEGRTDYPTELRRVVYHDEETDRDFVFMSNSFTLTAQEIADIYKARWQVELFFKWIKQNLKIKTFLGTSQNAVFIQIWVALIVFMLVWIHKSLANFNVSAQKIMQVMKTTLLTKRSISDLFKAHDPPRCIPSNQLFFVGFKN